LLVLYIYIYIMDLINAQKMGHIKILYMWLYS